MKHPSRLFATLLACATASGASLEWPQFAGPHRNFTSDAKGLANFWPASGPKKPAGRRHRHGQDYLGTHGERLIPQRHGHGE
jgi:hypothetical protein